MRTRTSPRNQEILWRALGNITKPEPKRETCDVCSAQQIMARPFTSRESKRWAQRVLDHEKLRASVREQLATEESAALAKAVRQ